MRAVAAFLLLGLIGLVSAEVYMKETFDSKWDSRWKHSEWKKSDGTNGQFTLTAGKWYGDAEADKGIQTGPDSKFFAIYSALDKEFDNKGKDLVLQFSAKHEQSLDCGGGYIKLVPSSVSSKEMQEFGGNTPYSIMFGPDICGMATRKVHVIITKKDTNHLINKDIPAKTDELTHVYTLVIKPDNTYKVLIDLEEAASGSLEDDWSILLPKTIKDPEAKKPEDWDEREEIPDETDVKPEGYDDIPATLPDADAKKPEDWDDEEDGEWEAPVIPNPDFKGEWKQKMIENPAFKGIWEAPDIPNPNFKADPELYHLGKIKYAGFELWQVKAGSIFDNIMVTDDLAAAQQFAKDTWGKTHEAEKAMHDKVKEAEKEAQAKAAAEASADNDEDDEEEEVEEDEYDETKDEL